MNKLTTALSSMSLAAGTAFLTLAPIAYAQTTNNGSTGALNTSNLGAFLQSIVVFIDTFAVPLIFALAFIVFIWGVYNYFILGAANEEKRNDGKTFILWGLIGFFVMFSIWGIINVLVQSFGFGSQTRPGLPLFNSSDATQQTQTTLPSSGSNNNANPTITNTGTGGGGDTTCTVVNGQVDCTPAGVNTSTNPPAASGNTSCAVLNGQVVCK